VHFNISSPYRTFAISALNCKYWGQIWRWHKNGQQAAVVLASKKLSAPCYAREIKYLLSSVRFNIPSPRSTSAFLALKCQFWGQIWRWHESVLWESVLLVPEVTAEPLNAHDIKYSVTSVQFNFTFPPCFRHNTRKMSIVDGFWIFLKLKTCNRSDIAFIRYIDRSWAMEIRVVG
jgi:hypothetical protein